MIFKYNCKFSMNFDYSSILSNDNIFKRDLQKYKKQNMLKYYRDTHFYNYSLMIIYVQFTVGFTIWLS